MAGRDDDEIDPSDWLAAQFGEAEEPAKPAPTPPPPAMVPPQSAPVYPPTFPPAAPAYPPTFTPAAPTQAYPPTFPPAAPPAAPPASYPPTFPSAAAPSEGAPGDSAPPPGGGFSWGLTPGVDPAAAAAVPPAFPPAPLPPAPAPNPYASAPPFAAPAFPPQPEVAPGFPPQPEAAPAFPFSTEAVPATPPQPEATPAFPFFTETAPATPPPSYDQPTQAFPYIPAATAPEDTATQAMPVPGQALEPQAYDPNRWLAAPVDAAFGGATEVIEAEIVGIPTPVDEGVPTSAIDSLFGESAFQDYNDAIISAPPPRTPLPPDAAAPPREPRPPLPKVQKVLLSVAGGLLAALALVALFLVGTRLPALMPAAEPIVTPTPTPTVPAFVLGPVEPGEYAWDELLGGECLDPWESAWQDRYTVVDCAVPHPAQMLARGEFADEANAGYPGFDELQKRINLLCTAPTVIDYVATGGATDIQVSASFAVDESDWLDGNRTYYCFVNRADGATFTTSIAIPQVAPTPTPTPTPTPAG